ncbi:MAG TPA: histidine kinase, partial [Thermoanaerobaculia bacterium]|nr:histidine kinase [Thermoanaerobaculia bacterium]
DTDIERARTAMAHFSDLLRTALNRTSMDEIPLRDELAFIESYLALERLRLGDRLSVTIDVPRDLYDAVVPTMVLQPLVENAIRHGVEHRRGTGRVDVTVQAEADRLRMRVINDAGSGGSRGAGIGLRNTRGRLHALYGSAQELVAGPLQDDRFEVSVAMPLRIIPAATELAS